ncbi:MAG: glycosyltransferase family 4 protein [Candidatus Krumholzibacteria bacterium]|nr:glycosyltransferase family 4 protein [Candidatus Krumholzibacteria bacterium]
MEQRRTLDIAMIGAKGIPAGFGGIEKHVEEISTRLVRRGHRVTVFGRAQFCGAGSWKGVRIRTLPTIPTKNLDSGVNCLLASMAARLGGFDIVHFHGIGPALFSRIPRRRGVGIVATIHALDYRQSKWGPLAKRLLRLGERCAVLHTDAAVAVSRLISDQLGGRYGHPVAYIPNGTSIAARPAGQSLDRLGVEPGKYILSVGRFIIERGFHTLIEAFREAPPHLRLVIVGDARFEERYGERIREMADERVVLPGFISGPLLEELYAHCAFYVLPSLVEGLPISLIEAMGHGRPVLVSDIPENLEVAGGIGMQFRAGDARDLASSLVRMAELPVAELERMGAEGRKRVEQEYLWDDAALRLEKLYLGLAAERGRRSGRANSVDTAESI